jgi:hypothetical protein
MLSQSIEPTGKQHPDRTFHLAIMLFAKALAHILPANQKRDRPGQH